MSATLTASLEKLAAATPASPGTAKTVLEDPAACALALLIAARHLCGPDWLEWEPETQWLTLEARRIDIPEVNRAKIQAAVTLHHVPSFYWDGLVFEKTALAFDGHVPNEDALEEATAAQLATAVLEAAQIVAYFGDAPPAFHHEPGAYAGVVLHREGFVLAPEQLSFAQAQLDGLNGPPDSLREQVKTAWAALDKKSLTGHAFAETRLDVQLAHLAAVELHVQAREARVAADLAALRG